MSSIYELMTNFCVISAKLIKLYKKRPVLTSHFGASKLKKQLGNVIQTFLDHTANFGLLPLNIYMHDSKPQRSVQQHKC